MCAACRGDANAVEMQRLQLGQRLRARRSKGPAFVRGTADGSVIVALTVALLSVSGRLPFVRAVWQLGSVAGGVVVVVVAAARAFVSGMATAPDPIRAVSCRRKTRQRKNLLGRLAAEISRRSRRRNRTLTWQRVPSLPPCASRRALSPSPPTLASAAACTVSLYVHTYNALPADGHAHVHTGTCRRRRNIYALAQLSPRRCIAAEPPRLVP